MQVKALFLLPLLASAAVAAVPPVVKLAQNQGSDSPVVRLAQAYPAPQAAAASPSAVPQSSAASGISQWYTLRQSDRLPFANYAYFLTRYQGWPGEAAMRRAAEGAIASNTPVRDIINYFRYMPPTTPTGRARYAVALHNSGDQERGFAEAREAWRSGVLPRYDEDRLLGLYYSRLTTADHDAHLDVLLDAGKLDDAQRLLPYGTPARRTLYETRIALQSRTPDVPSRLAYLGNAAMSDSGILMDQANWLQATGQTTAARQLLARPYNLTSTRADAEEWLETLLKHARAAAADRQWLLAYQIASQADKAFPAGTDVSQRSTGERDDYTSLVWLAGTAAYRGLNRPADAASMFVRYARGGRSTQVTSKGYYWAGRSARAAGQVEQANLYFEQAAAHPELFYGQLALERLGRPVPPPTPATSLPQPSPAERQAFASRDLVQATRLLGQWARWNDQSTFIRALADQAKTSSDRVQVAEMSRHIGRPDLAVWLARNARNAGSPFYARETYPEMRIPESQARYWSLAHGIMRQESSFDRAAMSPVGARGLMQLMPGTARETAGKMNVGYDLGRLTSDTNYNIMLGSFYFARLMQTWGGYAPLAIASYNAGPGNVRKWIANNGDPRSSGVDIVTWIEDIPFTETRGYVQRVLENTVVYDSLYPGRSGTSATRLSYYLGKSNQPG